MQRLTFCALRLTPERPEGVDGFARSEHDLVFATRMVLDEVRDVIDAVLPGRGKMHF